MQRPVHVPLWRSVTVGTLVLLWIGLSWLLVVSRGDPETFLRRAFAGHSMPDAFHHLNEPAYLFWAAHSCLVVTALSASWLRRPDVLIVLMIGPAIGMVLGSLSQRWNDPDWVVFVGVCLTGWVAGTPVGLVYWGSRPGRKSP